MATRLKRCSYVTDTETSSCEDGDSDSGCKLGQQDIKETKEGIAGYRYRKTKCSSRNAILARENRIKKKLYLEKLEREIKILRKNNSKFNIIVENQSFKITELKTEIKYLRSVLANSADLRTLINNIRCSTGMSVTTSLDKTLTLNNACVSKPELRAAPKPECPCNDELCSPTQTTGEDNGVMDVNLNSALDLDFLNEEPFPDLLFGLDKLNYDSDGNKLNEASAVTHNEHNYTLNPQYSNSEDKDVGVCLHVSKHRVSLEFCSSCSERAIETWKTT